VEEIDLVHDRTADSIVRFGPERIVDRALIDLEANLEDMTVISRAGRRGLPINYAIHIHGTPRLS
jgi:hypothetical protein